MMLAAPEQPQAPVQPTQAAPSLRSTIVRDVFTSVLTAVLTALILDKVLRRKP